MNNYFLIENIKNRVPVYIHPESKKEGMRYPSYYGCIKLSKQKMQKIPKLFINGEEVFITPEIRKNDFKESNYYTIDENNEINYYKYLLKDRYELEIEPLNYAPLKNKFFLLNQDQFLNLKKYIDKKYIIYFSENAVKYANPWLNQRKRDLPEVISQDKINLISKFKGKKFWIEGCNADFKVIDQGPDKPGILWSITENLPYEAWDRGDDPKRIPLVFKKPTDI